ncbi:unnamed protein product [Heterobilharzia americana]|nr:unnamed protein product [Heterobilharzia americana]
MLVQYGKVVGEDVAEYHQYDCHLERILDACLCHSSCTDSSTGISIHQEACGSEISSASTATTATNSTCIPLTQPISSISVSFRVSSVPFPVHSKDPSSTEFFKSLSFSSDSNLNRAKPVMETKVGSAGSTSPRPSPILPHLVLGSQEDANSLTICKQYGITHIVNVSLEGGIPPHIPKQNFHHIPVNDNYTDLMTPYFKDAFAFIDSAKTVHGRVLIHCSAGYLDHLL